MIFNENFPFIVFLTFILIFSLTLNFFTFVNIIMDDWTWTSSCFKSLKSFSFVKLLSILNTKLNLNHVFTHLIVSSSLFPFQLMKFLNNTENHYLQEIITPFYIHEWFLLIALYKENLRASVGDSISDYYKSLSLYI